jgi:hypothetical protein
VLHEFLASNRLELIHRCRTKVGERVAPKPTDAELEHGIPLFLDQLIKTLQMEQTSEPLQSRKVSGPAGGVGRQSCPKLAKRPPGTGASYCSTGSPLTR